MRDVKGKRLLGVGAGMAIALTAPAAAQGDAFVVNTLADDAGNGDCSTGDCTLREALTLGETPIAEPNSITFASNLTGTMLLGSDLPALTKNTTITGPGASKLAISGQDTHAIFTLTPPAAVSKSLTVENLTLTDGRNGKGGAIHGDNRSTINLKNSEITSSTATGSGGAVSVRYGNIVAEGSTISGNTAIAGGAVNIEYSSVELDQTTVTGNSATSTGGAVSSVSDNLYFSDIASRGATITGNTAGVAGGGFALSPYTSVNLYSTIFTANSPVGTHSGAHETFGANFSLLPASLAGAGMSNVSGDPKLGPLQLNGGETKTMLPAFDGAGVDKGGALATELTDQRGLARTVDVPGIADAVPPFGAGTDVGAVELTVGESTPPPKPPPPPPPPKTFDLKAALKKCKKKKSKKAKKKCKKKARKAAKAAAAAGATIV